MTWFVKFQGGEEEVFQAFHQEHVNGRQRGLPEPELDDITSVQGLAVELAYCYDNVRGEASGSHVLDFKTGKTRLGRLSITIEGVQEAIEAQANGRAAA